MGAGISGASVARELTVRGHDVVLLDAAAPGAGATGRNAGFLLAESECFGLSTGAHGARVAQALREIGLETREVVRELGRVRGLRWTGSVRLATDAGEAQAFTASAAARPGELRLAPSARITEAGTALPFEERALVDSGDGVVHPLRLLQAVLREAHDAGLRRFDQTPVRAIEPTRTRAHLTTDTTRITADHVIVCVNSAARLLLRRRAAAIRPVRAQALVAEVTPPPRWKRPVYATRGGEYWRPLPGGRVLLGGLRRIDRRRENTRDTRPTALHQRALDSYLRQLVGPEAAIQVTHRWAGTMAFTPDGLPWAGSLPGARRVHLLCGLNGHGMGWAPGLARRLVSDLCDRTRRLPAEFSPGR